MENIAVNVFKDVHGVYPQGSIRSISKNSTIAGEGYLSMVEVLEGRHDINFANVRLLRVDVPGVGYTYIDETVDSFNKKVGSTNNTPLVFRWVGDVDVPSGNVITDDRLQDITIAGITKGGIAIYGWSHHSDYPASLNLTDQGGLAPGEKIEISYK